MDTNKITPNSTNSEWVALPKDEIEAVKILTTIIELRTAKNNNEYLYYKPITYSYTKINKSCTKV